MPKPKEYNIPPVEIKEFQRQIRNPMDFFQDRVPTQELITPEDFNRLESKIDSIHRKLDLIFGDSVLINNQFVNLKL